jgi:hypothetical protein
MEADFNSVLGWTIRCAVLDWHLFTSAIHVEFNLKLFFRDTGINPLPQNRLQTIADYSWLQVKWQDSSSTFLPWFVDKNCWNWMIDAIFPQVPCKDFTLFISSIWHFSTGQACYFLRTNWQSWNRIISGFSYLRYLQIRIFEWSISSNV